MSRDSTDAAAGLQVHLQQVHKESLTEIENALPSRSKPDVEIFGMEGIPEDVLQQHNTRVTQEYYANEAAHRAASGNHTPGGVQQPGQQGSAGAKKPKLETPSDIKKRLAEHKAKKLAEQNAGSASPITPMVSCISYFSMTWCTHYPSPALHLRRTSSSSLTTRQQPTAPSPVSLVSHMVSPLVTLLSLAIILVILPFQVINLVHRLSLVSN